ncbi:MAG: LPS assembly lipoprotein LptE [Halieaceae bacterium]|nr:LPS assembly lipoprotein LptE [Halieaceae bacterium]
MRTDAARFAIGALLVLLAGCGFQLRGSIDLPPDWKALHLRSASPNGELANALRSAGGSAGIEWVEREDANFVVDLGQEQFQNRNLSIGANARATEFEMTMRTLIRVTDKAGKELLPETEVQTVQIIVNDPENIAGIAEESRLLRQEMRVNLVQQILRKLRSLAESGNT